MKHLIFALLLTFIYGFSFADGIIIADNEEYPGRILKSKSTNIEVNIDGLIVKTISLQEFQNEWDQTVNGVYAFPLPLNARVTRLMYSKGDTLIDAVLKIKPQSSTPGTGEGGLIAEINEYMGQNVIKLSLTNIAPNAVKWIKLEYITEMKHFNGTAEYSYPLDTEGFYSTPLDYLSVEINVHSEQTITDFDLTSHQDYTVINSTGNDLSLLMIKPLAYQASDIEFYYTVQNSELKLDFYSWNSDTTDGYFTMIGRPLLNPVNFILPTNMVFLIDNSSTMIGNKLNQSKLAVLQALDELTIRDSFNIAYFNYYSVYWQNEPVVASTDNINAAKTFVESIVAGGGCNIGSALIEALEQVENKTTTSSVLAFTGGKGYLDPYNVETQNTNKTGIFFVTFSDNADRHRLERTSMLNYGFVSYLDEKSVLSSEMIKIFKKINRPILKDVEIVFDSPDVYELYPTKFPAIYGDSDFKITGRYSAPGDALITIQGDGENGFESFEFNVNFTSDYNENHNARHIWTRNKIDDLESFILVYGENETLISELTDVSLREIMRCRYTAFVEDTTYSNFPDSIFGGEDPPPVKIDEIVSKESVKVYPNPIFNDLTIEIRNSEFLQYKQKFIKFYDLQGRLIYVLDFSNSKEPVYRVTIDKTVFPRSTQYILLNIEADGKIIESKPLIIVN